jgi:hypothetical protein
VKAAATGAATPEFVAKRVVDLGVHCLWMAYVLWVPWHPFWLVGPGAFYLASLNVVFAPVWQTFYGLLLGVLLVQLAAKLSAFVPGALPWLKPLKVVADVLGVVAIGSLALTSTYFVAAGAAAEPHRIAAVNHAMGLAFRIALVFAVGGMLSEGWKYGKRRVPKETLAF